MPSYRINLVDEELKSLEKTECEEAKMARVLLNTLETPCTAENKLEAINQII